MRVSAMPSLCDSTDFGLSKEAYNRAQGQTWLKRNPEIVLQLSTTTLYRVGDDANGFYFLWNPQERMVGYFMRYKVLHKTLLAKSVTQTSVWRSLEEADAKGLTFKVIFEILLPKYKILLSDKLQTERGRDLWIDLITQSLTKGFKVGLADFNARKVHNIASRAMLRLWDTDDSSAWSWFSNKHQGLRFFIRSDS